MAKHKEEPARDMPRAERIAERMAAQGLDMHGRRVTWDLGTGGQPLTLKRKKDSVRVDTRAERMAQKMAARIRESDRLVREYAATLDPRQFQTKEHEDGRS